MSKQDTYVDVNPNIKNDTESVDSNEQEGEFRTVDELASSQKLINCYQMQVDDKNNCSPVFLGKYPDVPLPVNKTLNYKKYNLHVVTYVLTEEEVQNKLFKIVGVNVFRRNRGSSLYSLDLVLDNESGKYHLLFNDHKNNKTEIVEKLEKFPGKDRVLGYIINKSFENPLKKILTK
ncbi:hypothetical protein YASMINEVIRUS_252 [Yasminevirus sp. GU-2018]|uniref:Uncharacterized protein n=1 Tax=Yasminevirus sp. GU-2018 TaxID=2420051 RepID=A0A5K0U766_9VIRU|nr:hypothetical protein YASMINEVIRUS_252 [Yasminevirus sp. GU-2018]